MAGYQRKTIKWDEFGKWEHGDILQVRMDECGYSVEKLAYKMNVGKTTIKNWLKNYQGPNPKNFKKLCEVLGVKPGYFLEDTPIKKLIKDHKIGTGKKPLKKEKKVEIGTIMTSDEVHDIYKMHFDLFKMATVLQKLGMKYDDKDLAYLNRQLQCTAQEIYKWLENNFNKKTLNDILMTLAEEGK